MKNIVWLILFSLLFLFGIKSVSMLSLLEEKESICILQEKEVIDQVYSLPIHLPDASDACVDVESLASQCRIVGRCQRQLSVTYSLLSKGVACRIVKCCLDSLLHSVNHFYTSLPRPSWSISSEYYVFRMRRILI